MASRSWLVAGAFVVVLAGAGGGVWWQQARSAAAARAKLLSVVEVELARDPLDRGGLVQADRDLEHLAKVDRDPELRRARARLALALRLPDQALEALDAAAYVAAPSSEDGWLRAQALALRHAIGGRIDDAARASKLAFEDYQSTGRIEAGLLAWQCATRIGDRDQTAAVVARLAADAPDAIETKVMQALADFDPENEGQVARARSLQGQGKEILELDAALAAADALSADETIRQRGRTTIQRVLEKVSASQPARLAAVIAHDRTGDVAGRNAHLRWLVDNFPNDPRAETWRDLIRGQ
ncbi:MAG: hypothetical protein R3F56_15140 [Planctomycetota bacterium]